MRSLLKNFTLFLDGDGYLGKVESIKLPSLKVITEDVRVGGMDAPMDVDMGMEKLMLTFTLVDYNEALIKKVAQKHLPTQLIFRGALEEESTGVTLTKALEVVCVGKVRSMEGFEVQAGQLGKLTFEMSLTYYRHKLGDTVTHEIDVNNLVRVIDGIDQLLPQRLALGL